MGPNLLDNALVPQGKPFPATDGTSSGAAVLSGVGLRTTATAATDPGVIQRFDLTRHNEFNATLMAEAPQTSQSLLTPLVGQIGESILSFTRTLAVSADQTRIFALTTSGLTVLNSNFDAVLAKPVISGIVNSADGSALVATGGVVDISGFSLASGNASAGAPPLPTSLGEVCALVNGSAIPLFSVSPSLLIAQLPDISGSASLEVHNSSGISAPFAFTIRPQAPAIFQEGTAAQVFRMDNNRAGEFHESRPSEFGAHHLCRRTRGLDHAAAGARYGRALGSAGRSYNHTYRYPRRRAADCSYRGPRTRTDRGLRHHREDARNSEEFPRHAVNNNRRRPFRQLYRPGGQPVTATNIRRKFMLRGLLCAAALFCATAAYANAQDQQWEIGATGGFGFTPDMTVSNSTSSASAGFKNGFAIGVHGGQDMYRYWSGEASYLYRDGDVKLEGCRKIGDAWEPTRT